jgi:5-methylcytosine-specific restriction endonuclease McrA
VKTCTTCNISKPPGEFYRRAASPDGLSYICRACAAAWRSANRQMLHEIDAAHRAKPRYKQRRAAWRRANREHERATLRAWAKANPAKRLQSARDYYARNRDKESRRFAKWAAANKDRRVQTCSQRRAKLRGCRRGDQRLVAAFYRLVRVAPVLQCYWCGQIVEHAQRQVDHVIPIARGGAHAADNLCVSCRRCNQRKGAKLPTEFHAEGRAAA